MKSIKKYIFIFILFTITLFASEKDNEFNAVFGIATESSVLSKFKDAKVVLKSWIENLTETYNGEVEVKFYNKTSSLYEDFIANKIDIAAVDLIFYFENKDEIDRIGEKKWTLFMGGNGYKRYYLLGNKKKKLRGFNNLKNKTISLKKEDSNSKLWLEKESLEVNKLSSEKLVKKFVFTDSDRTILLNLFFGKVDYGIVEEKAWNIILQINPAIEKKVEILSVSPNIFLEFIGFFSKQADVRTSEVFFDIGENLKSIKGSRKITEMLELDSIYQVSDDYLKDTNQYFKEYFNLKKKYK